MRVPLRTMLVFAPLALVLLMLPACAPAEPPAEEEATPEMQAPVDDGVLAADMLKDWESLKTTMMELGDAMPADRFDYKPTDELRNFGEQMMHIANANVGLIGRLDPSATPPELGEPTEKDAVMQAVSDSFDFGSEIMRGQSNAWATEVVEGPGFLGESTRARLAYRTLAHTWSEYGVMTVYLRLNDIVPPASR